MKTPAGRAAGFDQPRTLAALRLVTDGARLGDACKEALEKLERMDATEVERLYGQLQVRRSDS